MRSPKASATNPTGLKIIVQYRGKKRGKVYELKSGESVLAVHISPPEELDDAGTWHVEARSTANGEPTSVDGRGATAAEALSVVARAWVTRTPSLAPFNWDAVAHELHLVQAV